MIGDGSKAFSYDLNGNTTQEADTANLTTNIYDTQNRLISSTTNGITSSFKYDPFGRRIEAQFDNDSTIRFIYDFDNILLEMDENNNNLRYYTTEVGLDSWLSFHVDGQDYYYHKDGLSSIINITTQTEDVINEYDYDAFGDLKNQTVGIGNRILYTGRELDYNYYYYRSRYYNPVYARFITKDKFSGVASSPYSQNSYNYVHSNPINFNDPTGEIHPLILVGAVVVAGIIVYGIYEAGTEALGNAENLGNTYGDLGKFVDSGGKMPIPNTNQAFLGTMASGIKLGAAVPGTSLSGPVPTLDKPGLIGSAINALLALILDPFDGPDDPDPSSSSNDPSSPNYDPTAPNGGQGSSPNGSQQSPSGSTGSNPNDIPISIDRLHAVDPNDIIGPVGYDSIQWMSVNDNFGYTIRFENDPEFATGPAQIVRINCPIEDKLNLSSVRLGTFGFGEFVFNPPPNSSFYAERLDVVDSLNVYVDVTAGIDINNKEVFWIFESIDPVTGLAPLEGDVGFLPVNDTTTTIYNDTLTQKGEGYVTFNVNPTNSDLTGDTVLAQASIIFDQNEEIPTNIWSNIIDAFAPQSVMDSLPSHIDSTSFTLNWSAQDDPGGVGVALYDLYISVDENEYYLLETSLDTTAYSFTGIEGSTYAFYIRARDHVGNIEPQKYIEDTKTTIGGDIIVNTKVILQGPYNAAMNLMNDQLRVLDYLPSMSPYVSAEYPYASAQEVISDATVFDEKDDNSITDWIYIEIYDTQLDSSVAGQSCLLQRDGDIVGLNGVDAPIFENLDPGYYQLLVYHRNHLAIKTKDNVVELSFGPTYVDLSNDISILIGGINAVKSIGGNYTMIVGDIDQNGQVQNTDKSLTTSKLGMPGYQIEDLDMDGQVQQADIDNFLIPNLGRGKQFDNE